jgi:hypothetical protein
MFLSFTILFLKHIISALTIPHFDLPTPHSPEPHHLPQAPQYALRYRLFTESNAINFEWWISEVESDGAIRYFGVLNSERILVTRPDGVRQIVMKGWSCRA